MDVRRSLRRSLRILILTLVALPALGTGAIASPTSEIEEVWSFNGGAVAVQSLPNGTLQGTVVNPTAFARCTHPAGQVMWTDLQLQPDGSFWGKHLWYHGSQCEIDPQAGLTAWRVLTTEGARSLKVCFSDPSSTSQPKIAPGGEVTGATYGCVTSAPLAPLPGTSGSGAVAFSQSVSLPSAKGCVKQNKLRIALHDPKYDPLKEVVVKVKGKQVADVRSIKQIKRGIVLKHLPAGSYKVTVLAVTVLNQHLSGTRTYRSCKQSSSTIKLRRTKHHR